MRDELRRATLAFDRARTKKMRADVELATKQWWPLVVSRWSLLDDFASDGRRFVVAVERERAATVASNARLRVRHAHHGRWIVLDECSSLRLT